jgi:hypothetical protein
MTDATPGRDDLADGRRDLNELAAEAENQQDALEALSVLADRMEGSGVEAVYVLEAIRDLEDDLTACGWDYSDVDGGEQA